MKEKTEMQQKFISVCSGIEAASVAWQPLGWQPMFYSEIEAFPSAVLEYRHQGIPNLGDMTKFMEWPDYDPDVLVGGTPCQSFSVAGLRKGLADPRGNLMLTYLAIADRYRPRWLVWENVPGVLSSNGGRDFGTFLGALGQLGYGFAYRTLDAQYFGVPQRRRRVFVVGCLGGWQCAAAVLFERHSLSGDSAPSRETGQSVAALTAAGVGTCGADDNQGQAGHLIPFANAGYFGTMKQVSVSDSLRAKGGDTGNGGETLVMAHGQTCPTLRAGGNKTGGDRPPGTDVDTADSLIVTQYGNVFGALTARHDSSPCADRGMNVVAGWLPSQRSKAQGIGYEVEMAQSLRAGCSDYGLHSGQQVRRLTPIECERLQGFSDNYTRIPWRKKPAEDCPDGPRYKALGDSMAVPVMRWIGERISAVEKVVRNSKAA